MNAMDFANEFDFEENEKDVEEEIHQTIDDWKPTTKKNSIPLSQWRQMQNNGNHDQQPSRDDFKKIKSFIKQKFPDADIMKSFGIDVETLLSIKRGYFCPVDGVSDDLETKIYKKHISIEDKIKKIKEALEFLSDNLIENLEIRKVFRKKLGTPINKKPSLMNEEKNLDNEGINSQDEEE